MQITVRRDIPGRQGPDIIDGLLTDDRVGIARGRREIDYHCSDRDKVGCQCPASGYIATGSLARVTEDSGPWRGIVRYWSLTLSLDGDQFTADTRLTIEREDAR